MSNPNGNPGNKGGGRKSAYEETKMAKMLKDAFFKGFDPKEITDEIAKTKTIKLFKHALLRAAKNDKVLMKMFEKLYPSKIDFSGQVDNVFDVTITTVNKDAANKLATDGNAKKGMEVPK